MAAIGTLSQLGSLSLERCDGIPAASFSVLKNLPHLYYLDLRSTQADDIAVEAIRHIPRLQDLKLSALSAKGAQTLAVVFSIERLYVRELAGGDQSLKPLGRINRLRNLDIGGPEITGKGLAPLCRLPELQDFRLRAPDLTDVAFGHLSTAKSLDKLRLVEQGVPPAKGLTNEGMMQMARATWLKELWLPRNDTGITEAKIKELNELMPKTSVIPYTVSWQ